jgi:hypothetical protein
MGLRSERVTPGAGRSAQRTAAAPAGAAEEIPAHSPASGAALPGWNIPLICARESAPASCTDLEGHARSAVSAGWPFMLDAIKRTCLDETRLPTDQSWRLLAACLEMEADKAVDRAAVRTAKTPAEPVPSPKAPAAVAPPPEPAPPPVPATPPQ